MEKGLILLHDPRAIGIYPDLGNIGLYPFQKSGWMVGIWMSVDLRHYRKHGETGNNMTLLSAELQFPGPSGGAGPDYTGTISGWDYYDTGHSIEVYKPRFARLLPDYTDYTTFAFTDAYEEEYPYFYFGYGKRTVHTTGPGYGKWTNTVHMGVNYPISDTLRTGFDEVPPEAQLHDLMQPYFPPGVWRLRVTISSFTVDSDVAAGTIQSINVRDGRKKFYRGSFDFIHPALEILGEDDGDLSGVTWAVPDSPAELTIITGTAAGKRYQISQVWKTGEFPEPGFPAKTWLMRVDPASGSPRLDGAETGDRYVLTSRFFDVYDVLFQYNRSFTPGLWPEEIIETTFEPRYIH